MQRGTLITFLNKLANPTLKLILRSPLHALVSRSIMLITYTGRRSGKTYTTPVNYVRDGDTLLTVSTADRTWWRNLRGGVPVTLQVQGRTLQGHAQCVEELQDVAKDLRTLIQLSPGARKMYHASDGQPEDLKRIAAGRVVVRVTNMRPNPLHTLK